MENIVNLLNKLKFDEELFRFCGVHSLTSEDFKKLKKKGSDFRLELTINMEFLLAYDRLYCGKWSDVKEEYRRVFQVICFMKAFCFVSNQERSLVPWQEALKVLDVAIIIGAGLEECDLLIEFAQLVHDLLVAKHPPEHIELATSFSLCVLNCEIETIDQPSEEQFWVKYFYLHRPVKIRNCIKNWPALNKWEDLNYLTRIAGYRMVPIELGKKYDIDDWSMGMFRFGEFLKEFLSDKRKITQSAYLAQHDFFDQVPQLKKDFSIPDYCKISAKETVIKSWIGPANTISSMHTDDKHNLLCQVLGEKLIILASPDNAAKLYTHDGLLNNTSQVDPENLNVKKFPLAKNVKFTQVVLKAGEVLYIPKMWFHYVRSLTPSISISFWFDE